MDLTAFIDGTVALIVLGGCLWAFGALVVLGLGRSAADGDQAMRAYLEDVYGAPGTPEPEPDPFDRGARDWIAERRAS